MVSLLLDIGDDGLSAPRRRSQARQPFGDAVVGDLEHAAADRALDEARCRLLMPVVSQSIEADGAGGASTVALALRKPCWAPISIASVPGTYALRPGRRGQRRVDVVDMAAVLHHLEEGLAVLAPTGERSVTSREISALMRYDERGRP